MAGGSGDAAGAEGGVEELFGAGAPAAVGGQDGVGGEGGHAGDCCGAGVEGGWCGGLRFLRERVGGMFLGLCIVGRE